MPSNLKILSPFPPDFLPEAYTWFLKTPALMSRQTLREFVAWAKSAHSWAFLHEADLIGILLFEPVTWPGFQDPTDGYMTFAIARKRWGYSILYEAKKYICDSIFEGWPTVQRITGYTTSKNMAAQHAVDNLGGTYEGTLRDACGEGEDIVIYGLTRKEYYGRRT